MSKKKEPSIELPDTQRKDFMVLETSDQRQSLYDPIRREILRTLDSGIEDFETDVKRSERVLEDGTVVTEEVTIRRPVLRLWMSAQEIVDIINEKDAKLGLSNYNCYYHLHKLRDQGLVEQYPTGDEKDSGKRVRGMFFRSAAKFFVPTAFEISAGLTEEDVLPPQVNERAVELAQKVKETGFSDAFEYDVIIKGERYWFSITMSLHDDGESIISLVRDISETRRAQEALRRSQERLNLALKGADLAPWEWYEQEQIMIFGEKYADLLGYSQKEIDAYAKNWYSLVHPDDVDMVRSSWLDHLKGTTPFFSAEYRIKTKSNDYRWVRDRGSIVEYDSGGSPIRAAGIIQDITWEKLTLEALGQSEEKYQRLVNDSVQGIAIIQNQKIVFANPAYANVVRRSIGELLAMTADEVWQIVHPDDRNSLEKRNELIEQGVESLPVHRFRYLRPKGEVRWVDSYAKVIDYDGQPAIQALEVDVTEQYNTEQALKQSELRYRTLFENVSDAVFTTDRDGEIMYCNSISGEMFGYAPAEMIGMSIEDLIHPDDRSWVVTTFEANTLSSEARYQGLEARGLRKDGTIFYFHATGTALNRDGEHIGFQSLVRDITDRVESEKALRAQRDLAQMYLKMAGNIFLVLDRDGNISLLNRVGRDILEVSDDENVVGLSWFNFVPRDERDDVKQIFAKLMRGDPNHIDYRERGVLTRKGNRKLIAWRANLLYDENKEIIGLISSGEDITERRKAEQALRDSEEKYRLLVERSNIGIAITSYPPFKVHYVNKATEHTLGLEPERYMRASPDELEEMIHPADRDILKEVLTKVLEGEVGEEQDSFEYRLLNIKGDILWVRDAPQKVIYDGKPAVLSFLVDITGDMVEKRKKAQEIDNFRGMVNASANGMAIIVDERFHFVNDALVELLGINRDDIIGKVVWSVSPRNQPDKSSSKTKMLELLADTISGKEQKVQWILKRSDGIDLVIELELSLLPGDTEILFNVHRILES